MQAHGAARVTLALATLLLAGAPACRCDRGAPSSGAPAASAPSSSSSSAAAALSALASASASASAAQAQIDEAIADLESASVSALEPRAHVERLEATIVAPKVPGAADALAKDKWRLRGCAVAAADVQGVPVDARFELALLFDADGRVASVTPKTPGAAKTPLGDCLADALAKTAFPPPSEEGARAVVTVSLRATPLGRRGPTSDAGPDADGGR
jgi:hypothetical protein